MKRPNMQKLLNLDLQRGVADFWRHMDHSQRNIFMFALLVNVGTFFVFYVQHPLHNHTFRMPWIPWNDAQAHGRWFNYFVLRLIHAADIPMLNALFASSISVVTGMVVLQAWALSLSSLEKFLIVGLLTTFPFFLSFYYYSWLTVLFMLGPCFAALSILVCNRFSLTRILMGGVLFLFMMASYQVGVSVFGVLLVTSAISGLVNSTDGSFRQVLSIFCARVVAAILGGLAYILSINWLGATTSHATQTISLNELPERAITVIQLAFEHLYVSQPELLSPVKLLLLSVIVFATVMSFIKVRGSLQNLIAVALLWIAAVVATKALYLISPNTAFFEYRYNVSLGFLYAFAFTISIASIEWKTFRTILFLVLSFVVLRFVQADLVRQEVLMRGQIHDVSVATRILDRIENLPEFDTDIVYDFVRIGHYGSYRTKLLRSKGRSYNKGGDTHMDRGEITAHFADEQLLRLLGSRIRFRHPEFDSGFSAKLKTAKEAYKDKPTWPQNGSVFIENKTIYVKM